jgi:hydroxymethylpyrimidine pyrophosphatase-like HAD family hydrolase
MKLSAIALDYDGTIAVDGVFDPAVRSAIGDVRQRGIAVLLVTGRRLSELRAAAGDLQCFDAVVAENGAVVEFPASGRHVTIGHSASPAFVDALQRRGVPFAAGECVIETDASRADAVLEVIRRLEQPLILAFNRGRLMILPQAIGKSVGLRHALFSLRRSIHNTIAIGDAENDHDLLDACEVGVAVAWGSPALRAVADEVIEGSNPSAVATFIRQVSQQPRLSATQMGRRRLVLGHEHNGREVSLAVRGRTVLIAGEPGSGKSWLAGLLCEQSILQGYCLCIIDPEGDYRSLESLPGVVMLGGDDPPPQGRELIRALRHPDVSVVVDLSRISHREKREYLRTLLPSLVTLRRNTGLPHKILLDEAHYFLGGGDVAQLLDPDLAGYILITYRISNLPEILRDHPDTVVMVTREADQAEAETLLTMCRPRPIVAAPVAAFGDLAVNEAALLPGAEEAYGRIRRFRLAARLTEHVRHQAKYLDMPVTESQAFVFTGDGEPRARARTLKDFIGLLAALPADRLIGHLRRHDFSRWIHDVFRDHPLAAHMRAIEARLGSDDVRDITEDLAQLIRARYETRAEPALGSIAAAADSAHAA